MRKNLTRYPTIDYVQRIDLVMPVAAIQPVFFNADQVLDDSIIRGVKVNTRRTTTPEAVVGSFADSQASPALASQADLQFFVLTLVNTVIDRDTKELVDEHVIADIPLNYLSGMIGVGGPWRYSPRFCTRINLKKCFVRCTDPAGYVRRTLSFDFTYQPIN